MQIQQIQQKSQYLNKLVRLSTNMGNKNTKASSLSFKAEDWSEVEKSTFYEVMRNKNGQDANLYHFNIKSDRQLSQEVDIYYKRKSPANWVQVIGAKIQETGFGFCGSQESANVLTERIPLLLDSISRLSKEQSNVVIYNSLKGFKDLCQLVVPGSITDKMIGFTSQGHTKVWVNENFGMNYPSHFIKEAQLNERVVINNLVNAISPHADLPNDYVSNLKSSDSFNNAINFIRSNGGVSEAVLQSNQINISKYSGNTNISVLRDTSPISVPQYSYQPSVTLVQPVQAVQVSQPQIYQPRLVSYQDQSVIGRSSVMQPAVRSSVNFSTGGSQFVPYQGSYQIPNRPSGVYTGVTYA